MRAILKYEFLRVRFSGLELMVLNVYLDNKGCSAGENASVAGLVGARAEEGYEEILFKFTLLNTSNGSLYAFANGITLEDVFKENV